MNEGTNWLPGIFVLAGGLLIAAIYLVLSRQKGAAAAGEPEKAAAPDGVLEDLERRIQVAMEQLKELIAHPGALPAEQFAAEKTRLELAAAAALRARDEHVQGKAATAQAGVAAKGPVAVARAPVAATGFFGRHPELKGALWGGGVVLFFVTLGLLISEYQRPRGENDIATGKDLRAGMNQGGGAAGADPAAAAEDASFQAALTAVKEHPENLEAAAEVAHELIRRQQWDEANTITERSLGIDPFHAETRVHRAVLAATRGDLAEANASLDLLANLYPDAQEALLFQGAIAMQSNEQRRALDAFERFAVEAPRAEHPPQLFPAIAMLRQQLGVK